MPWIWPAGAAENLSADSRQVYRGMDIGTGKDLNEYGDVPYHLIDIVPAGTRFDLYQWQQAFEYSYKDIRERGRVPILCGGTGLYIQAATCGYTLPQVPPDEALREELEQYDAEILIEAVRVRAASGRRSTAIQTQDNQGFGSGDLRREHPVKRTGFLPKNPYYIGTLVSREERVARIDKRLDERLPAA